METTADFGVTWEIETKHRTVLLLQVFNFLLSTSISHQFQCFQSIFVNLTFSLSLCAAVFQLIASSYKNYLMSILFLSHIASLIFTLNDQLLLNITNFHY